MDRLAREVLLLSRNTLMVNLRFLDAALSQLSLKCGPWPLATDGRFIFYNAKAVLQGYRMEKERPVRDYLHMVFHCVFRHGFLDTSLDRDCWNLACDIAVEAIISQLNIRATVTTRQDQQKEILEELKESVSRLTAETLYRHFLDHRPEPERFRQLCELFIADDHEIWYSPPEPTGAESGRTPERSSPGPADGPSFRGESRQGLFQHWKSISEQMQTDLETFSHNRGDSAGGLMQSLKEVNRERYDYASFLRKFAVLGEIMNINDDEFDYIFYTYGMKLYGNMPLIEPLEYKEVKRIREFVIAIDTSGSVKGDLVQKFIQKTYNILKQEENFFRKINLHIIQCDAEIQESVKITSQEEFDRYLRTMELHGFGGTDFRPVFRYVDALRKRREFVNLKGLIYFTDGFGAFPEKKPEYQTAFVFVQEDPEPPMVPAWAIRLMLEPAEI